MGSPPKFIYRSSWNRWVFSAVWPGWHRKRSKKREGIEIRTARIQNASVKVKYGKTFEEHEYRHKSQYTVDEAIEIYFLMRKSIAAAIKLNLESGYGVPNIVNWEEKIATKPMQIIIDEGIRLEPIEERHGYTIEEVWELRKRGTGKRERTKPRVFEMDLMSKPLQIEQVDDQLEAIGNPHEFNERSVTSWEKRKEEKK